MVMYLVARGLSWCAKFTLVNLLIECVFWDSWLLTKKVKSNLCSRLWNIIEIVSICWLFSFDFLFKSLVFRVFSTLFEKLGWRGWNLTSGLRTSFITKGDWDEWVRFIFLSLLSGYHGFFTLWNLINCWRYYLLFVIKRRDIIDTTFWTTLN